MGESKAYSFALMTRVLVLTGTVCAVFAAVAAWAVLALFWRDTFAEPAPFAFRVLVKAGFFSACAIAGIRIVLKMPSVTAPGDSPDTNPSSVHSTAAWGLLAAIAFSALLFIPNLDRFPWPAPDELHHLVVARNLAEHGAYASGLPPDRLIHFDHYDSVGAPVIGAAALAFTLFGTSLEAARLVVAAFGVLLIPLAYALLRPVYSRNAALAGACLPLAAFGTIYLGRTLYGELPAFVFLLGGLLLWRCGLNATRRALLILFGAGLCFGLCALSKTFMLMCAFAFAGVWWYDCATFRRIPLRAIFIPALGLGSTVGAWQVFETLSAAPGQPSTLLYYRHSLVFGAESMVQPGDHWLTWIPPVVLGVFALSYSVPRVFRDRYDPALAVLFLIAPLFSFWWLFFTPHHIYRYLWYSAVIVAMFTAPVLIEGVRTMRLSGAIRDRRLLAAASVAVLAAWVYGPRLVEKGSYVLLNDQARPERTLVEYVQHLPEEIDIATTYWPAERLINFAAGRPVDVVSAADASASPYGVIIHSERLHGQAPAVTGAVKRFGHYVVYRRERYRAAEHRKENALR